ncbi:hypothetical protein K8B33_13345 [Alcanivorax sp. JB21]|uniref:hypothetical protein n=1 Tax=Alcanivorax limicola TaxID=2874102 RepID=UPI001CBB52BB|nr:hypothetical protein [Alcanivorax limicola]MBZ2190088.1 hypothetical protein [Alcanivorax limicola]
MMTLTDTSLNAMNTVAPNAMTPFAAPQQTTVLRAVAKPVMCLRARVWRMRQMLQGDG